MVQLDALAFQRFLGNDRVVEAAVGAFHLAVQKMGMVHRLVAREAALAKTLELFARGPMTAQQLINGLGVNRSTGFAYLRQLR